MCSLCIIVNYKQYQHHKLDKIRIVIFLKFKFNDRKCCENIIYLTGSGRRRARETFDTVVVGSGQCAVFTLRRDNTRESRSMSLVACPQRRSTLIT